MQNSKYSTDIQRFRTYPGMNYIETKEEKNATGTTTKVAYPIITIYIPGYNLKDILAVTVNRGITDSVSKQQLDISSFFIEHLTRRSHILQVRRLPSERRGRLEKFLILFNQTWCTGEKYILDLQGLPDEFKDIAQYLEEPVMDEKFRRQLKAEEKTDNVFNEQEARYLK